MSSLTDLHPIFLIQKTLLALFVFHWVLLFLWENGLNLICNHLICFCRKARVKIQHKLLRSLTFSTFTSHSAVTQMLTSSFLFLPLSLLSPPFLSCVYFILSSFFHFCFSKSISFFSNEGSHRPSLSWKHELDSLPVTLMSSVSFLSSLTSPNLLPKTALITSYISLSMVHSFLHQLKLLYCFL